MVASEVRRLQRALESLVDEIKSEDDILDLLDNLEAVASALAEYKLTPREVRRSYSLDVVVKRVGKVEDDAELKKLAKRLRRQIKETRKASYDGGDDETSAEEATEDANALRETVHDGLSRWLQGQLQGRNDAVDT